MGKQYLKIKSLEPSKSFYLTVKDSHNTSFKYVAKDEEFYSSDNISCRRLDELMRSDGVLVDIGTDHDSQKAIIVSADNIVTLYFYLVNERYFSIDFDLSYFKEKMISMGVTEITNFDINPLKL